MIRRSFQSLSPIVRQRADGLVLRYSLHPHHHAVLRQRCLSIHPAAAAAAAATAVWPLSHAQHRTFSDRLLGHSPMAPASVVSNTIVGDQSSRIPTERDVSVAGGVWNPTSAKRDKLAELKGELTENQETLDDAATDVQKLDLYLADGIQWIVHTVDQTRLPPMLAIMPESSVSRPSDNKTTITTSSSSISSSKETESTTTTSSSENTSATTTTTTNPVLPHYFDPTQWDVEQAVAEMESWIQEQAATIHSTIPNGQLQQEQWETYLSEVIQKLDELLTTLPASRYLRHVRDFYEVPQDSIANQALMTDTSLQQQLLITGSSGDHSALALTGSKILARYRLQLTKATCEHLKESWETLTTLSDEAVDRLAVKAGEHGNNEEEEDSNHKTITSLPLDKVNKVIQSSLLGDAVDRVDAWWALVDQDGDGLLEKTEMEQVATSAVTSVQSAIVSLFEEALEAAPVTQLQQDDEMTKKNKSVSIQNWRERRRERKAKKRLTKTFQRAVKKHFEDEVEMPHRLRCIYAWAEKSHQDNKVDSVLIEASGWSGRKRYVELQPKISLPEFREVQQVHFTHLDRIGWEITKSFREDLWVEQGKGRQTAELKRDCLLFLLVVSVVDYGIIIL